MSASKSQLVIGLVAIGLAGLLYFIAIPFGVSKPSNVSNIVLSPDFWPIIISILFFLVGTGLILTSRHATVEDDDFNENPSVSGGPGRLALMAVLMVVYTTSISTLGIVWSSMVAFIALVILIKSDHPIPAVVMALCIPLMLYAFFAHVAGVALPQGIFVRLP